MSADNFQRAAVIVALIAAFVVRADARASGRGQSNVLPAPRSGLVPVHQPNLDELEPGVREQLFSFQDSLAAQTKDHRLTDVKLSEAYGLMGQVYHAYSLTSPAIECYLNAHQLAPKDFRWPYFLADVLQHEGRIEDAVSYYTIARSLRPDYLAAPVNLGNLHLQQNQLEEARSSFKEALVINARCTAARYGLGQVALSLRNYAEAVEYLEQALAEAPEATRIHYALAMAYRGLGNIQKAEAHLQQQGPVGIRVSDPLVDGLRELIRGERLHLIRGRTAFDALRFAEAADEFRKAIAANPTSVAARVNLGSALAQTGDVSGAIEQYREAIRIDASNAQAHYNLGLLLAKQNQHDQAIARLQTALSVNPRDDEARFLLAKELLKAARSEDALKEFSRVVESDSDNEEALLEQVKLLFRKKQYRQAIQSLEKGNALFPQKGRTAALLAYLLASSPQYDLRDGARALALAKSIYQATGLVNHGAIVAMALAELGRCSEAADWQRQMIALAEREVNRDIVEKLKTDLKRYESSQQCRPPGDANISTLLPQDERPRLPDSL
jgi:tetratricopeptide (TPR) repeat protein